MGVFRIFMGDREKIQQKIKEVAGNLGIKYSTNIFYDLNRQYGLLYTPKLLYFIYSKDDFPDKDSIIKLKELVKHSKVPVICILNKTEDKRNSFYKMFSKQIEQLGTTNKEKDLDDKLQKFYSDIKYIKDIEENESISFLYKLYYNFKHPEYKEIAGFCINLVLTGQVKSEQILKVFLAFVLDKNGTT